MTSGNLRGNAIAVDTSIENETMESSELNWSLLSEPHEVELREPLLED